MIKINSSRTLLVRALKVSAISLLLGAHMSHAAESVPLAPLAKNLPEQTLLVGSWTGETKGEECKNPFIKSGYL